MTSKARRTQRRAQHRQEILEAARTLFLRDGHERFTMRGLAKELDCAPGTLYLYFADKTDLIKTLVEDSFEVLMSELERLDARAEPLHHLESIMRAYIDFGLANPPHYHFAFMLPRTPKLDQARPRPHRSYAFLQAATKRCVDEGAIGTRDPELAAQAVWTGIHGVTSLLITMPNFPWGDKASTVEHVVASLLRGLDPVAPASPASERTTDDPR